jgi:hypothetical protein
MRSGVVRVTRPDGTIGLADAIEGLRYELALAAWWGNGQQLRFKPGPVELTVEATVTSTVEGHGGVRWWIVDAGASGSADTSATQTVKLTLEPVMFDAAGQPVELLIDDVVEPPPVGEPGVVAGEAR